MMKGALIAALTAVLAVSSGISVGAQGRPDFSGEWVLDEARSMPETRGISPRVSFATEILFKVTEAELHMETSSNHKDSERHVYKFDGREETITLLSGTKVTGKVAWEGPSLLLTTKRSFASPMGDITVEFSEVYSVADGLLTVTRTQVTGGETLTGVAVYTKVTS